MREHSTLTLSKPRAEQLRRIAKHRGQTIADFLDETVKKAWAEIGRGDEAPPFFDTAASLEERLVVFSGKGTHGVHLTPEEAQQIAEGLRQVVAGERAKFRVRATGDKDEHIVVHGDRQGRGFRLAVADLGTAEEVVHGLTGSVALDIAHCLEAAARRAAA